MIVGGDSNVVASAFALLMMVVLVILVLLMLLMVSGTISQQSADRKCPTHTTIRGYLFI
jgi:competence protein ComGC